MEGNLSYFLGLQIKQLDDGKTVKLSRDDVGKGVDNTMYRSMIGSLLYLTASRPDIMYSVCLCARYLSNPKESHLKAVKRIIRPRSLWLIGWDLWGYPTTSHVHFGGLQPGIGKGQDHIKPIGIRPWCETCSVPGAAILSSSRRCLNFILDLSPPCYLMKNVLRFAVNCQWEDSINQGTRNPSASGYSEPTKAPHLLPPLGPVRLHRAVATDFTSSRLCFALWIADTDKSSVSNFGARIDYVEAEVEITLIIEELLNLLKLFFTILAFYKTFIARDRHKRKSTKTRPQRYRLTDRQPDRINHMRELISISDRACVEQLRMDRNAFARLCYLVEHVGGLAQSRNVLISEQVALFLSVLAHHKKNRVVKFDFKRSGFTVSKHFRCVLDAVLRLHPILAIPPSLVDDTCTDNNWKCMKYNFILIGWEGSAADNRVLRDAVTKRNGLRVPYGKYYLCDCGYTNSPGFLMPYIGVRYHLSEWSRDGGGPTNYKKLFNLHHAKARNAIERSFDVLPDEYILTKLSHPRSGPPGVTTLPCPCTTTG
ncbi:hypothetical protein PHJA_001800000 [Phtheirospermum japonicum]|uniref:Uncharacterized protein n=1 Tax=Phtheirospermum japonicum TaxID=374723 RepID=A0A830CBI6_9LAMI|nr:hypothetical protein PHJA_001800000 [Phtheirospermum japonicum]